MDLSGSVCLQCQCFKCHDLSSFGSFLKSVHFTPVDWEISNFKPKRQHLKLRNSALFYVWKMQESGPIQIISLVCTSSVWGAYSCILSFLRVHHRKWLQSNLPSLGLIGSRWRVAITDSISQVFLLGHGFDQYLANIFWSTFVPRSWEACCRSSKNAW